MLRWRGSASRVRKAAERLKAFAPAPVAELDSSAQEAIEDDIRRCETVAQLLLLAIRRDMESTGKGCPEHMRRITDEGVKTKLARLGVAPKQIALMVADPRTWSEQLQAENTRRANDPRHA